MARKRTIGSPDTDAPLAPATQEFVAALYPYIRGVAKRCCYLFDREHLTDDMIGVGSLAVVERFTRQEPNFEDERKAKNYVYSIIKYAIIDDIRREALRKGRDHVCLDDCEDVGYDDTDDIHAQIEGYMIMRVAFDVCNDGDRRVIGLYCFHDKTMAEIAFLMGITEAAVSMRLKKIITKVRQEFGLTGQAEKLWHRSGGI
jgi:RNA polymerase sigma factor (sigma-70 family)